MVMFVEALISRDTQLHQARVQAWFVYVKEPSPSFQGFFWSFC